jgi:hypothetical protein
MFEIEDTSRKGYAARGALIGCLVASFLWWIPIPIVVIVLVVRSEGSVRRLYARSNPLLAGIIPVRKWYRPVGSALSQSRLECDD